RDRRPLRRTSRESRRLHGEALERAWARRRRLVGSEDRLRPVSAAHVHARTHAARLGRGRADAERRPSPSRRPARPGAVRAEGDRGPRQAGGRSRRRLSRGSRHRLTARARLPTTQSVGLFAAVVSYTLPDVDRAPGRLPVWLYRALPLVGLGLVSGCLVKFGATLHGFVAAVFALALVVITATDLEYRLIPNRVVGPASLVV